MKKTTRNMIIAVFLFILVSNVFSYINKKDEPNGTQNAGLGNATWKDELYIVSGSENKELEPILERFSKENKISLHMKYQGSVDIARELGNKEIAYDAVWPASSMWISIGDVNHVVKHTESVSITPVVFGIRQSLAEKLGFTKGDVSVRDILAKIRSGELKFCMTSATQSNSGCSAYIGFLYALLGSPEMITEEMLSSPQLADDIKALLAGVDRSSGSSEWLKTLFLEGDFDAMVNYESLILTTNEELRRQGREELYIVYPYDGLSISDAPLGYIDKGDSKKEENFLKLKNYLMSPEIQKEIQGYGRRTGFKGIADENRKLWEKNPGAKADIVISPIRMPAPDTLTKALGLYQTEFRKPSFTVYVLDYSGSMSGNPLKQLRRAMSEILLQENAAKNLLQASSDEKNAVLLFSSDIISLEYASGNIDIEKLNNAVQKTSANGGTSMYEALNKALSIMSDVDLSAYNPAIILMTDGVANGRLTFEDFEKNYLASDLPVPVFSISFGSADVDELNKIAKLTQARVFDGASDLVSAFRKAKGYN